MIEVKSRTITLSYSQNEIEEVREILNFLQVEQGFQSDTMKGLFLKILKSVKNSS